MSNTGGLSGQLNNAFNINASPAFTNAAGSLGTVVEDVALSSSLNAGATDPEGSSVTHSISSGSLPTGLSIASSTGLVPEHQMSMIVMPLLKLITTVSATDGTNSSSRHFNLKRICRWFY